MSTERFIMENKTDSNSSLPIPKKYSPRIRTASLLASAAMFLSGCAEKISGGNLQIDNQSEPPKVNVESYPTVNDNISDPAAAPTQEGENIIIESASYPTNADNFIIDTRPNEQKMHLVKTWAPEDVEKEIALYNAEFERRKMDPKFIKYQVSIVDGKSWVLYPKDIRTNETFIVSIDDVIRPSIDLFGLLDKSTSDDFFHLIKVNIPNAQVIGDKSGWHVFAEVIDGKVTQWYDATKDRINKVEVKAEEAPEKDEIKIKNTIDISEGPKFIDFSRVTLEDFTSGKLLELERKWLEDNPFPENAIPFEGLKLVDGKTGLSTLKYDEYYEVDTKNIKFSISADYSDLSTRPIKVISYYVLWDEELFESIGITDKVIEENYKSKDDKFAKLGIMSWAYLNPDKSTVIGHSIVNLLNSGILRRDDNLIECPLVDVYNYEIYKPNSIITDIKSIVEIYSKFPDLKPLELSKKWINSKIMPKEIENKLFGIGGYAQSW